MSIPNSIDRAAAAVASLPTPSLLIDGVKLDANIARMNGRAERLRVTLRPHVKTSKSIEVTRRIFAGRTGPITVSTLREAEYFYAAGFSDILYAVEISPDKLGRALALRKLGADLIVTVDDPDMAVAVARAAHGEGVSLRVAIEIDSDGHRAGLAPGDTRVLTIAHALMQHGAHFHGLMTHAGESYNVADPVALTRHAELERASIVASARALREAGVTCPTVSVGSTPTLTFARDLEGVSEARAGVYVFQDLYQVNLGVCTVSDLALSVLTTVISRRPDKGWIVVDAGGLALSKDRGTAGQKVDYGYGLVCDELGIPLPIPTVVQTTMQEHGLIRIPAGGFDRFPIGRRLRILPSHACMTAAAHDHYYWLGPTSGEITRFTRCNGW